MAEKDSPTRHAVPWPDAEAVIVDYEDRSHILERQGDDQLFVAAGSDRHSVGAWASLSGDTLSIKLAPGCQDYFTSRELGGKPVTPAQLVAAVIVAAIAGHPDADDQRA